MELKYQDKNLIATYLQIYLRDYYGLTVQKKIKRNRIDPDTYELTTSTPIQLTGYLNSQTYSSIAMYMVRNYPNEKYPTLWVQDSGTWIPTTDVYDQFEEEIKSSDEEHILRKDIIIPQEEEGQIIDVIVSNMENLSYDSNTISVPHRVLSYLFGEVVSPLSTPEEVLRVKSYLKSITFSNFGTLLDSDDIKFISAQINAYNSSNSGYTYDDTFKNIIWQLQDLYIRGHRAEVPEQFIDFKATGYVDPWTEHILKGGSESEY